MPPTTVVGLMVTEDNAGGGVTVKVACTETLFGSLAVMWAVAVDATVCVLITNVAEVCPLWTVTLLTLGEAAAVLSLESAICIPELPAAAFKVTVPTEVVPPLTDVGFTATEDTSTVVDAGAKTTSTQ